MEEKNFNEKESLELISKMIRNTQNHMEGNEGIPFLVWGYVTLVVTAAVWLAVSLTGNDYWHLLWFAIPVLGIPLLLIFNKKQPATVKTYIDKTICYIWGVIGSVCLIFSISSFFANINILSIILILIGSACTITGLIIKFLPSTIGGIISIILSVVLDFIPLNLDVFLLIFAIAFIANCIVPGHFLNCKARRESKNSGSAANPQEVQNV